MKGPVLSLKSSRAREPRNCRLSHVLVASQIPVVAGRRPVQVSIPAPSCRRFSKFERHEDEAMLGAIHLVVITFWALKDQ